MPSRSRSRGRRAEKKDDRSRSQERKKDDRERSRDRKRDKKDDRSRSRGREKGEEKSKDKRTEAIELKPGVKVRIHGLQKNPEKNGAVGTLLEYNEEKQRWAVEFPSSATNNFKIDNLEACTSNPELDGMKDEEIPTAKIFVSNLAQDTTVKDLTDIFAGIGQIAREPVRDSRGQKQGFADDWPLAVKMSKPGRRAGDARLEYVDKCAARAAVIAFDGFKLKGNRISVCFAGQGMTFEKRELTKPWAEREENRDKIRND